MGGYTSWPSDHCQICKSRIIKLSSGSWVHMSSWLAGHPDIHKPVPDDNPETVSYSDSGTPGSKDMLSCKEKGIFIHEAMIAAHGEQFWKNRVRTLKAEAEYWRIKYAQDEDNV